jgi:hypothetical protein
MPSFLRELVGDADLDYGPNGLANPLADDHLEEDVIRTHWNLSHRATLSHKFPYALCRPGF